MKTLLVTPFAPYRDGIATYAAQELRKLRADGETVDVLSPLPSAARWHLKLGGPTGMVQLGRKAARYDRTVLQFGPELLFGGCRSAGQRVGVWAALAAMANRTSLDVRIHEIEYGPLEQNPVERRAAKLALDQADRVTVHTEAERDRLNQLLGLGHRIEVVDHGRDFTPTVTLSTEEARLELGLAEDHYTFVAIGFLQHHKGFDRAVDAMAAVASPGVHLHVVGSARVDHPEILGYVEDLRRRCDGLDNVTLHERFVSDVEFDVWIQAADTIVLPYREIWSSGVLERARLFGRQILAADLPPLRDQAPSGAVFATEVDELALAMEALALASAPERSSLTVDDGPTAAIASDGQASSRAGATMQSQPWQIDRRAPDRARIEAQIVARARSAELQHTAHRSAVEAGSAHGARGRNPVDPLLALGPMHRPQPNSARPGVAPVKRVIDRLIGWQIDPLASRVEALQRATVEAVAALESAPHHGQPTRRPETPTSSPNPESPNPESPKPESGETEAEPVSTGAPSAAGPERSITQTDQNDTGPMLDLSASENAGSQRMAP